MAFMQPDIQHCDYFACDTSIGTEYVPADVIRLPFSVDFTAGGIFDEDSVHWPKLLAALYPYCEGTLVEVCPKTGWLARLSAPGYMDCTDWSPYDTEEEAVAGLKEMYGDDDEQGED